VWEELLRLVLQATYTEWRKDRHVFELIWQHAFGVRADMVRGRERDARVEGARVGSEHSTTYPRADQTRLLLCSRSGLTREVVGGGGKAPAFKPTPPMREVMPLQCHYTNTNAYVNGWLGVCTENIHTGAERVVWRQAGRECGDANARGVQ